MVYNDEPVFERSKTALIVVDMQNGFMRPDGTLYCGDQAREIIPRIVARVQGERDAGAALFFTQDSHVKNDKEFEMFPPHCIEGSEEEQLIDELALLAEDAHIIKKRRYSAFFETELAGALDELWPDKVVVMERGRVVEAGPPDELLRRPDGVFRKMYDLQMGRPPGDEDLEGAA